MGCLLDSFLWELWAYYVVVRILGQVTLYGTSFR
ncbi:hypothetical protein OKW49_006329 [Paraburkholderia youngii]